MNQKVLVASFVLVAFALLLPVPSAAQDGLPRTAWGDPDLQGHWTNTTTTPLERPDDLGDTEVLTGEEWAARNAVSGLERRPSVRHGRLLQRLLAGAGTASRAHVADRRPAERQAAGAHAGRGRAAGGAGAVPPREPARIAGNLDGPERLRPLPHARHAGLHDAGLLQPQLPHPADARPRGDPRRDDPRHAHHPARRARPPGRAHPAVAGRFTGALGGQHAGRRDHEPERPR